jgi:hypothetical protein
LLLQVVAAQLSAGVHESGHDRQADGRSHHDYDDLQRIDDDAQDATDGVSDRFSDGQADDNGEDYQRGATARAAVRVGS